MMRFGRSAPVSDSSVGGGAPLSQSLGASTSVTVPRRGNETTLANGTVINGVAVTAAAGVNRRHSAPLPASASDGRTYRQRTSLCDRRAEVAKIKANFPGKVVIILEKYKKERSLPPLDRVKFLVPQDVTLSQFVTIIRNRLNVGRAQAIYFLVDERAVGSMTMSMGDLYEQYHDKRDGFLYMTYASQEMFG